MSDAYRPLSYPEIDYTPSPDFSRTRPARPEGESLMGELDQQIEKLITLVRELGIAVQPYLLSLDSSQDLDDEKASAPNLSPMGMAIFAEIQKIKNLQEVVNDLRIRVDDHL